MNPEQVRTVLVLSADMGEGHNATGRALAEAAQERWPGCTVRWLDTLDVMGPGIGPLFRQIYVTNVESTPWLYEYFYASLWRHRWFARSSKAFVGIWCAARLAPRLRRLQPDVILSTYPLGSAGLAWLRRRGRLDTPAAAWVSDFAPHPFWVYPELDKTYVMDPLAVQRALAAEPGTDVQVSELPVLRAFRQAGSGPARQRTRARLGVGPQDRLVMVSSGALGFGEVVATVQALLQAGDGVHVLVVCGRNAALRAAVEQLQQERDGAAAGGRLLVRGWVEDMPDLLAAADAVVSNAGGATCLEALAAGRQVLMYRPIAAHGRANAELMAQAGAAEVCLTPGQLTEAARRLVDRPAGDHSPTGSEPAALAVPLVQTMTDVAASPVRSRPPAARAGRAQPLAASDALFLNVDTEDAPQQIGTVAILDPGPAGPIGTAELVDLIEAVPRVRGRLRRGGLLRSPSWSPLPAADLSGHVDQRSLDAQEPEALAAAVDDFFSGRLDLAAPPARIRLLHGLPDGQQAVLVQVHHALCDGVVLTSALVARAMAGGRPQDAATRPSPAEPSARVAGPVRARGAAAARPGRRPDLATARHLAGGLLSLARGGRAPRSMLTDPLRTSARSQLLVDLPTQEVRRCARTHATSTGELVIALVADALPRAVPELSVPGSSVRVMVPRTMRSLRRAEGGAAHRDGNRTGATPVDLPTGPMPFTERVAGVRAALRGQQAAGQPAAARQVLTLVGVLPPGLRRWVHRRIYSPTWFNAIGTMLPAVPRGAQVYGRALPRAYPVLPLAPGTQLAFGALPTVGTIGLCLTLGPVLATRRAELAEAVRDALARAAEGPDRAGRPAGRAPTGRGSVTGRGRMTGHGIAGSGVPA